MKSAETHTESTLRSRFFSKGEGGTSALKIVLIITIVGLISLLLYFSITNFYQSNQVGEPASTPAQSQNENISTQNTAPGSQPSQNQSQNTNLATATEVTIKALMTNPQNYLDKIIQIKAKFYGWKQAPSSSVTFDNQSCFASRSEYALDDGTGTIFQNNALLYDSNGTLLALSIESPVQDVVLKAKVALKTEKEVGMSASEIKCVFLEKP